MRGRRGRQRHPHFISPLLEDTDLAGTSIPHVFAARLVVHKSLSLSSRVRVGRHPVTHHNHPQDPTQDRERDKKIES
jgi:hypothetical protein